MIGKKKKAEAKAAEGRVNYDLIISPLITEKTTGHSEHNKVVFKVRPEAKKGEIKEAVEGIFKVKVLRVNTISAHGKVKRFRGGYGVRSDFKKAIVTLAEGQKIELASGV